MLVINPQKGAKLQYTRVKRAVSAVVIDGADSDANPDFVKVNGNVTFTPLLKAGDVVQYAGPKGPESLVLAPIECRISDGIIMHRGQEGVYLVAGGEGVQPDVIQWKATFSNMQAGGWAFTLKPVMFDAVPGGDVDLTLVSPIAGASEPIVRGPAGVGLKSITVEGSELVVTVTSEAGDSVMTRIPLEDVVKAEAAAAAKGAADSVRTEFTTAASSAAANAKLAATSAQTATSKAGEATTQAANAKTSASSAKNSEANALSSANAAKSSASSAATSETSSASSASEARGSAASASSSASKADTSERNAKKSADNSYMYSMGARSSADRAANIADSTSWNGDRLTVNGKTSPSLRGPKGDSGASAWGDIKDKPATFPPQRHTHDASEITGTTNDAGRPQFGGKVLTPRRHDGKIFYYSSPTEGKELANKAYVDREVGALAARAPRGKPVEVVPAGLTEDEAPNWLRGKLVEYGTTYDTVVVLPFDLDTSQATSMKFMFTGCSSLVSVPPMNTSNVTNMSSMFDDCSSLVSVPPMNTSNVTNMYGMFKGCLSLTAVPPMNTSNVTNMSGMFSGCSSLIQAEVRLYRNDGTKPADKAYMLYGTQLTREPFYTPDGIPIT